MITAPAAAGASSGDLILGLDGLTWADLQRPEGLALLSERFDRWLKERDGDTHAAWSHWRAQPASLQGRTLSGLMVRVAPHVGAFVARLFGVEREAEQVRERLREEQALFDFRKHFVKKRLHRDGAGQAWGAAGGTAGGAAEVARALWSALGGPRPADEERWVARATLRAFELLDLARKVARAGGASWTEEAAGAVAAIRAELSASTVAKQALDPSAGDEALLAGACDAIEAVLAARMRDHADAAHHWATLHAPHAQQFETLVPLRVPGDKRADTESAGPGPFRTRAEPFALTDARGSAREAAAHVDYCIYCHEREKDSCSRGLRDKGGALKQNPLGVELAGCPLEEKIGEAHQLRGAGEIVGALAVVAVDNPLCPGTGHRICNDCMKACIFQTQEPVNIPMVETRALDDVLALPWGFEIWSLLTRWNPLSATRPHALAYNGHDVLVVGLGPAGYTLAHYLLNEGFGVVGIDGLKIEPLPRELIDRPIRDVKELREPLDSRTVLGFGGVSEYGITVRWDKTYLTMLYLNLVRRRNFRCYGGVRFGGTLTLDDAWKLGFAHVAIAAGAGRPTMVSMENGLARGVRQASDFLMALQLGGAFKKGSLSNLQARLPAVVIGGGLTAIDAATEVLAFYVVQAERTLLRYETLSKELGEERVRARFDDEERGVLDETLAHGRALRAERARAEAEGREPDFRPLLDSWGGVRVAYRRRLQDSPAYRLNHEEVIKAMEEGVRFVELVAPVAAHVDAFGAVERVTFEEQRLEGGKLVSTGKKVDLQARTVLVAAGTSPNVSYEREHRHTFELDGKGYFRSHAVREVEGKLEMVPGPGFFTSYFKDGRTVSYYGDNHPRYAGSVVKAMASAKDGHPHVVGLFARALASLDPKEQPERDRQWGARAARLDQELTATVVEVQRLAPGIVDVVVRAPLAARHFEPGQFYRLQTFERFAPRVDGEPIATEGIALTGAWTDREQGVLSMIVLEVGASTRMCAHLQPGDPVLVMGPTGTPTEIPKDENVLLVGGGLGNAVLFSIAKALKAAGSRVLYVAGYRNGEMLFKREQIEQATDQIVWTTDADPPIAPARPQDRAFRGNVVSAIHALARGELGEVEVPLASIDRLIAIGSDGMMAAVGRARRGELAPYLPNCKRAIGSINSPMQCMMKEICAQCLQRHVDPFTGKESFVYSCVDQDQALDEVDFTHLKQRLRQGSVQEKIADLWYAHLERALS